MGKLWTDAEVEPFETVWRSARVLYVVDGDTMDVEVDVGFDTKRPVRVRLMAEGLLTTPEDDSDDSVDAWETRGVEREQGLLVEERTLELIPVGSEVRVYSRKGGSRGSLRRWLCIILYRVEGGWHSLGDTLIEEGHAEFWRR